VVGVERQLIVGMKVGREPSSEANGLASLRVKARRDVERAGRCSRGWLLADAGFDGREVEWTDGMPPVRGGGSLRSWCRVLRGELVARARASGLYGQRWKVETVASVIKFCPPYRFPTQAGGNRTCTLFPIPTPAPSK
jgi:hypothetical protein